MTEVLRRGTGVDLPRGAHALGVVMVYGGLGLWIARKLWGGVGRILPVDDDYRDMRVTPPGYPYIGAPGEVPAETGKDPFLALGPDDKILSYYVRGGEYTPREPGPYDIVEEPTIPTVTDGVTREERIAAIDVRVPSWVKERWTPSERRGGVTLGPEKVRVTRRVGGMELTEV